MSGIQIPRSPPFPARTRPPRTLGTIFLHTNQKFQHQEGHQQQVPVLVYNYFFPRPPHLRRNPPSPPRSRINPKSQHTSKRNSTCASRVSHPPCSPLPPHKKAHYTHGLKSNKARQELRTNPSNQSPESKHTGATKRGDDVRQAARRDTNIFKTNCASHLQKWGNIHISSRR